MHGSQAALDANGARLFTGSSNGQVRLWNINSGEAMVDELSEEEAANFVVRAGVSAEKGRHTATDLEKRRQVRVDITGHARIKYVGKYHSCMVLNGRLIPHAWYLKAQVCKCRS